MKDRMENHGFDIVYKNRSKLSRFESGGPLIAIKKDFSSKWKPMRSEFDYLLSVKIDKRSVCLDKEVVFIFLIHNQDMAMKSILMTWITFY